MPDFKHMKHNSMWIDSIKLILTRLPILKRRDGYLHRNTIGILMILYHPYPITNR